MPCYVTMPKCTCEKRTPALYNCGKLNKFPKILNA